MAQIALEALGRPRLARLNILLLNVIIFSLRTGAVAGGPQVAPTSWSPFYSESSSGLGES